MLMNESQHLSDTLEHSFLPTLTYFVSCWKEILYLVPSMLFVCDWQNRGMRNRLRTSFFILPDELQEIIFQKRFAGDYIHGM